MTQNTAYFPALTGIRAIAAYMVFIHHYIPEYAGKLNPILYGILNELHIGVTVFFVLSGFLIANAYLHNNTASFYTYMVKRFARIYPSFIILTVLSLIVKYGLWHIPADVFITNITLIKGYFKQFKFSGIAQTWSLTVEETFYLSAPFSFMLIRKSYKFLFILPFVIILIGMGLVIAFGNYDYYGFMRSYNHLFNYTYFGRPFEFFCGIALCYYMKNFGIPRIKLNMTYAGIVFMILCLLCIYLFKTDQVPYGIHTVQGMMVNNILLPVFGISFLFAGLVHEKTWISQILGSKTFIILGKSSYIFYLLHTGVLTDWLMNLIGYSTTHVMFTFVIVNGASVLLYYVLEKPLNSYLLKSMIAKNNLL